MEKDLVTILTPCYNGESFIHRYIESILRQTYSNIELILVDDGSTDTTVEVVEQYREKLEAKCKRFIFEKIKHGGQARAVNHGLKFVKGEFLVWPDSDDYLSFDSIEKRVCFLKKYPEFGFVRSNGQNVDFDTLQLLSRISDNENRYKNDIYMDLILEKTYCACGCYMLRTELLFDIYPEREIYISSAGQNWQLLIPYSGRYHCGYLDENQYFISLRSNSHSRIDRSIEEEFQRLDDLRDVLEHVIPLAKRLEYDYQAILDEKYYRMKFNISYLRGNISSLEEFYWKLGKIKCRGRKEILQYCELRHKFIFRIYLLFSRIKRKR